MNKTSHLSLWFSYRETVVSYHETAVSYCETAVSYHETKCFLSVKLTETSGIALSSASFSMSQQDFPKPHLNRTAHSGRFSFPEHKPKEELFLSG